MKKKYLAICSLAALSNPSGDRENIGFSENAKGNPLGRLLRINQGILVLFRQKSRHGQGNSYQKVCINPGC